MLSENSLRNAKKNLFIHSNSFIEIYIAYHTIYLLCVQLHGFSTFKVVESSLKSTLELFHHINETSPHKLAVSYILFITIYSEELTSSKVTSIYLQLLGGDFLGPCVDLPDKVSLFASRLT
jgi:hypothetical protein